MEFIIVIGNSPLLFSVSLVLYWLVIVLLVTVGLWWGDKPRSPRPPAPPPSPDLVRGYGLVLLLLVLLVVVVLFVKFIIRIR